MPKTNSLLARLGHAPWMDIILVLLGTVLLTEFYRHLAVGSFTPIGFAKQIQLVLQDTQAPEIWKSLFLCLIANKAWLAPVFAVFVGLSSLSLLLLFFRGWVGIIVSLFFFSLWISFWAYPGIWIFEFLFPALIGGFAAMACFSRGKNTAKYQLLGKQLFGKTSWMTRITIILIASGLLWYFILLAGNAREHGSVVAAQTAITFAIIMLLSALLDRFRFANMASVKGIISINTASHFIILTIAAMLVMQVFSNHAVNWFTVQGFQSLIENYATQTAAPSWFKNFLLFMHEHASLLMPLYFIFETCIAILLSLLILRGPMLLLAFILFAILTFAEFGVSARWPVHPGDPTTWLWELLFVTIVAFFIGVQQTAIAIKTLQDKMQSNKIKQVILGDPLYTKASLLTRVTVAIATGGLLWLAGYVHHVFGASYKLIALQSGISFALLLIVLGLIDYKRRIRE